MKKGIQSLFLALALLMSYIYIPGVALGANAADSVITFPDRAFETAVRAAIGKPSGNIYKSSVEKITSLDVRDRGIKNMAGIEYFTSLMILDCGNNQLTRLDLSNNLILLLLDCSDNQLETLNLHFNTYLEWLACDNNELTSLNIIQSANLTWLSCFGNRLSSIYLISSSLEVLDCSNNQLTSLHLQNYTKLKYLYCAGNDLGALDVGNAVSLIELDCGNNRLTSLAVSSKPNLTMLDCRNNQLTSLDIRGNTALELFGCNGNQLTSLDVSESTKLSWLYCYDNRLTSLDVSKNPALTQLYCSGNQLTSLEVSDNPMLTLLFCHENKLTSLDISSNPELTDLICSNNQLTSLDVRNNQNLGYIFCTENQLTSLDLSNNPMLTGLLFSENQLTGIDLSYNKNLEFLYCSGNQLTSLDVSSNPGLTELICYDNQLTSLDVSRNPRLVYLYCNDNQLDSLDITKNPALTELDCSSNNLTSLDVSKNRVLVYLDCSDNNMVSESSVIGLNKSVTTTFIFNQQKTQIIHFRDPKFEAIVRRRIDKPWGNVYKSDVSDVTILYVNSSDISDLYGIEYFSALTELNCSYNQLISLDVSKNTALTYLTCANNKLTSLDVSNNPSLTSLYCDNNQLTGLDVSGKPVLTWLNCSNNKLTSLNASNNPALTELKCYNNQLTTLNVSNNPSVTLLDCSYNQLTSLDVSGKPALTWFDCSYNQLTSLDVSKNPSLYRLYCNDNYMESEAAIIGLNKSAVSAYKFYPQRERAIIFPDANFEAAVRNVIDKPEGDIYKSNLAGITNLDVSEKNISDLTGLEYFTSLAVLDCSNNRLTSLDVSRNPALTELNCLYNYMTSEAAVVGLNKTLTADFAFYPQKINPISIAYSANGRVKADKTIAEVGETITLTITPRAGYQLKKGTLKYNGSAIDDNTFIMPAANVTITAEFELINVDGNNGNAVLTPNAWVLSPDFSGDLALDYGTNWEIRELFFDNDHVGWNEVINTITVDADAETFTCIVKVITGTGAIKYIGVEKSMDISEGTYSGSTWFLPSGVLTNDAILTITDWEVKDVFHNELNGLVDHDIHTVTVYKNADSFDAIIKLKHISTGQVNYISILKR